MQKSIKFIDQIGKLQMYPKWINYEKQLKTDLNIPLTIIQRHIFMLIML